MKIIIDVRYSAHSDYITLLQRINRYVDEIAQAIRIKKDPAVCIEEQLDMDEWVDIEHKVDLHFYKGKVIAYPIDKKDTYETNTYVWVEIV